MSQWIDAKEKTPEIMINVLVKRKNDEIQVDHRISYPRNTWRIAAYNPLLDTLEVIKFQDVTHWKSLEE